jgi:hypothetical protein
MNIRMSQIHENVSYIYKEVYTDYVSQVTRVTELRNSVATRWQQDGDLPGAHGRPAKQMQPLESKRIRDEEMLRA